MSLTILQNKTPRLFGTSHVQEPALPITIPSQHHILPSWEEAKSSNLPPHADPHRRNSISTSISKGCPQSLCTPPCSGRPFLHNLRNN